ncbi:hypothetical protein [Nesterenkonia halobia]|uniref:Uncharacterized protein n=1 Tax=Nesterenkonia halobia TaxID=37922 RepID=A0ABP6RA56_9MICC
MTNDLREAVRHDDLTPAPEESLPATLHSEERGDVPGWVMITLMSAVLVAGLLAIAQPALEGLFSDAMDQVRR